METARTKSTDCQHLLDEESFRTLPELEKENFRHFLNEILRNHHLLRMLPGNITNVIDVGCGTGYMACLLAQGGKEVTAVDISERRLFTFHDIALRYHITQVHSDLFQLEYTNSFDMLVCQEVLEHLEDYEWAVQHMTTFIKPEGYAVFCVPYEEDLRAKMKTCPLCHRSYHKNGHLHSFSERKLRRCFEQHHLNILKTELLVNKRTTKWFARIKYPARRGLVLFDTIMNSLYPRKAAYLAMLCRKVSS